MRSAAESEARRTTGPNKARLAEEENWTKLEYFDAEVCLYVCFGVFSHFSGQPAEVREN